MTDTHQLADGVALYRRLLRYTRQYKLPLAITMLAMAMASATDTLLSVLIKPLIDDGFIAKKADTMHWIPMAFLAVAVVRGVMMFVGDFSVNWVGSRIVYRIRNELFERIVHLPARFYDTHSTAVLISKLIYDVEQIAAASTHAVFVLIRNTLTVIGLFSWMLYLNWQLTTLFLILVPVLTMLVRIMTRRLRRVSHNIQRSMGDITKVTQEAVDGQRIVKAYTAQDAELRAFDGANNRYRQQFMKLTAINAGGAPLIEIVAAMVLALVLYIALYQAGHGGFTPGEFVAYFSAMMLLMPAARNIANVNQTLQKGIAASHSAFSLLDEPIEQDTGTVSRDRVDGRVEYRDVSFRYPSAETTAVQDVSFAIAPGEMVALVGASGSGKTTLATLLARFYTVASGAITIDGVNINEYRLANLRSHIAIVTQETILFDDSIRNNIGYGVDKVDEQRLQAAADAAHVTEFVRRLPEGLDTRVGEKGARLSGGQRQRVAIARAIYKDAPILILDEATSALDTESERHVQAAMEALTVHRTTLVIAHRLSTIEKADRIVVMDQGRIVESGPHQALLARGGYYAGLYRLQFAGSTGSA